MPKLSIRSVDLARRAGLLQTPNIGSEQLRGKILTEFPPCALGMWQSTFGQTVNDFKQIVSLRLLRFKNASCAATIELAG
jgi:hypothetical protein